MPVRAVDYKSTLKFKVDKALKNRVSNPKNLMRFPDLEELIDEKTEVYNGKN